jgi:sulfopropanediol 3-dehydrogenase
MAKYIKKASKTAYTDESNVKDIVENILKDIKEGKEEKVLEYTQKFDNYSGNILVTKEQIKLATDSLSDDLKKDIQVAYKNVKTFAQAQRDSMDEFEMSLGHGLVAGQKLIPMNTAGCYIPGGRYSHVASVIMSITTAKVAGVKNIVASSPVKNGEAIPPAVLYAMDLCGADYILALGGVQSIAAMTYGLFTGCKADILVGPGNAYVAEAKRMLYGEVGIDMFAGPSEVAVIADETADINIVASDLVGQAEHGPTTPAWLFTTDEALANNLDAKVLELIDDLPTTAKGAAFEAWRDYGEIILCDNREELVSISDEYASEHLEVHCNDLDWYLENLTNYGSLFLGEETTVAFGDKCAGPNHVLPTKGAAKYSGGLYVGKFIKTVTYQRMTREGVKQLGPVSSRLARVEGMEAHAITTDDRLKKYYPNETFDLGTLNEF